MAGLTVYTKLLDKTLEGARIIDMGSTKSCECFVLPRDLVAEVGKKHPVLHQHSFYILLGKDKKGRNMAYIGETQDFTDRVIDHKQKKDFWTIALVFVSKANEIFASEVLYLEYLGYQAAVEAGNYIIENPNKVNKQKLSPDKEDEMELFFEDILFLTRFYGCKVFDEPEKPIIEETGKTFTMTMPKIGLRAILKFYRESNRYVIAAGSNVSEKTWDSCPKGLKPFREHVFANPKLVKKVAEKMYVTLEDIDIPEANLSPSGAASFCAGTSYQGPEAWVDEEGKKYPKEWWK
ncbi:MAG: GIY-YIG nuclease family protein [Prevotella sp.]|nr:GIY-YIG nuclease family protein [Prevotella sp.]